MVAELCAYKSDKTTRELAKITRTTREKRSKTVATRTVIFSRIADTISWRFLSTVRPRDTSFPNGSLSQNSLPRVTLLPSSVISERVAAEFRSEFSIESPPCMTSTAALKSPFATSFFPSDRWDCGVFPFLLSFYCHFIVILLSFFIRKPSFLQSNVHGKSSFLLKKNGAILQ